LNLPPPSRPSPGLLQLPVAFQFPVTPPKLNTGVGIFPSHDNITAPKAQQACMSQIYQVQAGPSPSPHPKNAVGQQAPEAIRSLPAAFQ